MPCRVMLARANGRCLRQGKPFQQRLVAGRSKVLRASGRAHAVAGGGVQIQVNGSHLVVTDAINEYTHKKLSHVVEPFQAVLKNKIDVRMSVRGGDAGRGEKQQTIEVTIRTVRFGVVRAEVTQKDLYAAIDLACDKISRSLRKLKEKAVAKGNWPGRGSAKGEASLADVLPSDDEFEPELDAQLTDDEREVATSALDLPASVKKTKVFYLDPLSLSEALDKLEQVDHDFYVYLDRDTGHVQVCYRRNEGGHGLIVTVPDNADLMS